MSKAAVGDELFTHRRSSVAGNVDHRDRHRPRRHARAERLRDRRQAASRSSASRTTTPSRRRNTASTTCSIAGICGFAPSGSRRSCACATRSSTRCATSSTQRGFILADTPIFTPAACEGHDDAVSGAVLRRADGVPDAERPALQRSQRDGARPRVLLRPDVPRREIEDAAPPDRVLDGRAGDGVRRPERRHGARRRARRLRRRPRARQAPAPS